MGEESISFGVELRRLRLRAGWKLTDLAEATYYSKSHLSKVETGRKAPSAALARACDTALGAEGRLAALVKSTGRHTAPDRSASSSLPLPQALPRSPDLSSSALLGAFSIGSGALLGLSPSGEERPSPLRSANVLATFRTLFDQMRVLGQRTGPGVVLPSVVAQTHSLIRLARGAEPQLAASALLLASRFAEYGGWMAQETGDDRAALWWTDHAVELASEAGDQELRAHALIRRACVAMYAHDGLQTVELARQAYASAAASPRIRALACEREAQGHALTGDYGGCRRALDRAAEEAEKDTSASSDRPVLGSSTVPNRLSVVTGWCLYDVGRPAEAADVLDRALAGIPRSAVRARTRFGMRRALAHAGAGNLDRACELAHGLLDEFDTVDSATVAHDVRQLARTLSRWHNDPAVRALNPRLVQALRRPRL